MNKSTIMIIAGGVIFAVLSAVLVQLITAPKARKEAATQQAAMVDILVAAKDLKIGEELAMGSTQWRSWPESGLFPGAITRKDKQSADEALKGRLRREVASGEPLFQSALLDNTKSNFVAASLTSGMRAVAITVSAQSSVGGFLSPGDHVDVIMTYDVRLPSDDNVREAAMPVVTRTAAQTLLENVKVLAVDQETAQIATAKLVKTVTLEVDGKDAELLALAGDMGKLSLTLRGVGDTGPAILDDTKDKAKTKATTDLRISNVMSEIMRGENNTGSTNQVVRVYSGTRVENVSVRPSHAH